MRFFRSNLRLKALFSKTPVKNHKKNRLFPKKPPFCRFFALFPKKFSTLQGMLHFLDFHPDNLCLNPNWPEFIVFSEFQEFIRLSEGRTLLCSSAEQVNI
jgi:hypothetical protein